MRRERSYVGGLDVKQVDILVILAFIHTLRKHLGKGVVEAFYAAMSLGR